MIVEDQPNRRVHRIRSIEQLEELDELTAAVPVPDQGMHLAGDEIDPSQQADRAVTLVLEFAREGRVQGKAIVYPHRRSDAIHDVERWSADDEKRYLAGG